MQALVQVSYNFMVANAKAIREFRKMGFKNSQIGIVHTTNTVQILKDTPEYRIAQRRGDLFKNKWVTDPAILGISLQTSSLCCWKVASTSPSSRTKTLRSSRTIRWTSWARTAIHAPGKALRIR